MCRVLKAFKQIIFILHFYELTLLYIIVTWLTCKITLVYFSLLLFSQSLHLEAHTIGEKYPSNIMNHGNQ